MLSIHIILTILNLLLSIATQYKGYMAVSIMHMVLAVAMAVCVGLSL